MNVEVVLAPNPGIFTGRGTNTWVLSSQGAAMVIDPGPLDATHRISTVEAIGSLRPVAVVVTHLHSDHAPAANDLAGLLGVPAIGPAFGDDFRPDRLVSDGDVVTCGALQVEIVATPGHTPDSICYRVEGALFTGDHIMGGSTVIVEDMADYLGSLRRLRGTGLARLYPGHGPVIRYPDRTIDEYLAHRLEREAQILGEVRAGSRTIGEVVEAVYRDTDPMLHPAAAISVAAHLGKLADDGLVEFGGDGAWDASVRPAP